MSVMWRSALVVVAAVAVSAVPAPSRSTGNSGAAITFGQQVEPNRPSWQSRPSSTGIQFGQTSATSNQQSTGDGAQLNTGEATAISVQEQSGLGGATQVTNNQALIQAAQQAAGGEGGSGNSQQTSNNQVNIQSSQLQQNVDGTLVNVQTGHMGVVIVNTNDPTGAVVHQEVINNKPVAKQTAESSQCRYICRRPHNDEFYCCDDGSNIRGEPGIHGGQCPAVRLICNRNVFFRKCGHDGQCAASDKCCYDTCVRHHICKSADEV